MQNAAAAGLVAIYFAWFAGRWITAGFTPDDLMNCHRAMEQPLWKLLLDHVTVFLPSYEYRPFGNLFYRLFYGVFGFQPLPFHVGTYIVLVANLYLTYKVVRNITNLPAAAWIATVFHAWHGNWTYLHLSVGFCYDVFCYFFFTAALLAFGAGRYMLFFALFLLALNSKEMAVSLPLVCLVWKGGGDRRSATAALAAGVVTAAFIGGRLMVRDGLIVNEAYVPRFDLATLLSRLEGFLEFTVYGEGRAIWGAGILLAASLWALAYRRHAALVSLTILFAGILPVAFIPQRGLEAAYVPFLGLATLLGLPLASIVKQPLAATLVAVLLAGTFHHLRRERQPEHAFAEARHIADVARHFRHAEPCLPPGARLRFIRDPFPQFDWNSYFLVRLMYDDPTVQVDRPGRIGGSPYYAVFDWDGGGGPGQGVLRRSSLDASSASSTPNTMPSK